MKKYTISGMSCAACQSRVEKAVNALPNVDSAVVSLLTNSMQDVYKRQALWFVIYHYIKH